LTIRRQITGCVPGGSDHFGDQFAELDQVVHSDECGGVRVERAAGEAGKLQTGVALKHEPSQLLSIGDVEAGQSTSCT